MKPKARAAASTPNVPPDHPEAIAKLADTAPLKSQVRYLDVAQYVDAIRKLHDRGYSYAEIATWLNEQLAGRLDGKKIKRGQVYHVYQRSEK
jgi:hypothetical protein